MEELKRIPVDLNGRALQLVIKPFAWGVAGKWVDRVVKMLAAGAIGAGGGLNPGDVLGAMSDSQSAEFRRDCEAHTFAVFEDDGKALTMTEVAPRLAGRSDLAFDLWWAHIETQFTPFFGRLMLVAADLERRAEEAKKAASST